MFYSGGGRDLGELNFREGGTEGGSVVANASELGESSKYYRVPWGFRLILL